MYLDMVKEKALLLLKIETLALNFKKSNGMFLVGALFTMIDGIHK